MDNFTQGARDFQRNVFERHAGLFAGLAESQNPQVLFITCCDSRIDPCLITQTRPGDMMVIRNAGNIVPPAGVECSEAAGIEFCVAKIGVKHIVVCGHSDCGAMRCLLWPEELEGTETVGPWVAHSEPAKQRVRQRHPNARDGELHELTIKENVVEQLKNLGGLPFVAERVARGGLALHGWYYDIGTGIISKLDPVTDRFEPLG
jgi:carbonic anhydrase